MIVDYYPIILFIHLLQMSHLSHFLSRGVGDLLPDNLLGGFWLLDNSYFFFYLTWVGFVLVIGQEIYFFFYLTWVGGIRLLEVDEEEREEDAEEGAGGK